MGQKRLNSLMICNIHGKTIDELISSFIHKTEWRENMFSYN